LEALSRQGHTISGYPRVRPSDCDRVTKAIRKAFEANRPFFRLNDQEIVVRFDAILDAYLETDVRFYPREAFKAKLLHAEAKLLLSDFDGVRRLTGHFADRPYAIEGGYYEISDLMWLDCQMRALTGEVDGLNMLALSRVVMLSRLRPFQSWQLARYFASFLGLGEVEKANTGLLAAIALACSRQTLRAKRGAGTWIGRVWARMSAGLYLTVAAICLFLLRYGDIPLGHGKGRARSRDIIVTRAMGGIGDLLMMTPGLRALAKNKKTRVKFLIPRKFFPLFAGNPHVELVDIDGPPVDTGACRAWHNLTICPAAAYESRKRPFVRKSRVELFARGLRVSRWGLYRHGWNIDLFLDARQQGFCGEFLAKQDFGRRPVVGIQPYSRDSYKDHPMIVDFIESLAKDYDIIAFHHIAEGLPEGPGIATTAGLPLADSLALVSILDAMVCVDSAFLHAAAAFDIPVFAIFGPTDGKLFTRHHNNATVLDASAYFPCAPCWRNEDLACQLTSQFGYSPCVASISLAAIKKVLAESLAKGARGGSAALSRK
jgi:ADP-heptose:LPS heptosyltransferase